MLTVARQFARTLKEMGVRYVFGVPSGNMTDYIEAIRNEEGIEFVLTGHETSAGFMAAICGRFTGIPGVCFGTFGPGATNMATGVGCALLDRYPVIAFTDEMPGELLNRTVQMNIDHQALFHPITKWTTRLVKGRVDQIIRDAGEVAVSEVPGPVHIGVPAGIGQHVDQGSKNSTGRTEKVNEHTQGFPEGNWKLGESLFRKSRRPILAIGLSSVRKEAGLAIQQIAEKFRVPMVLTPMAKGIVPESHPFYAGVLFHALSDHVAQIYCNADLVLGIGYDPVEYNYEEWMPDVPLIHFDSRPADVDRVKIPEIVDFPGNLHLSLDRILKWEIPKKDWDPVAIGMQKNDLFQKFVPEQGQFGPIAIMEGLRKSLPAEGILTVDVGAHLHLAGQMWKTPAPDRLLMTNGWSSMGFAIPAAISAKLCNPKVPVACLTGDGGFLMMAGELATAKRLSLKIVFVVIYDNSLSLIRIKQAKRGYDSSYGTTLSNKVQVSANHYFGVPVFRVTDTRSYHIALERAFTSVGPVVLEAVTDGSGYDRLLLKTGK